jgi:outer membrane protein OmpA-like peptidoglycan-associated protein
MNGESSMSLNAYASPARASRFLLLIVFVLALVACAAAPPPKLAPSEGARQREGLRALGFQESEGNWHLILPEPLWFDFGSAEVKPESARAATDTAHELLQLGIRGVRLEGHSDNVGPASVNLDLSQRRADAVGKLFVIAGFAERAVVRHGRGASLPIADNTSAAGRARNRRVELVVAADALAPEPAAGAPHPRD